MINQSRLSQVNSIANARNTQDDGKVRDRLKGATDQSENLAGSASLLSDSNSGFLNNSSMVGKNSFTQLLEMSKVDKPEIQTMKKSEPDTSKKSPESERGQDISNKKTKNEAAGVRKTSKAKDKKEAPQEDTEQALSQLLTAQKSTVADLTTNKNAGIQNMVSEADRLKQFQNSTPNTTRQLQVNTSEKLQVNTAGHLQANTAGHLQANTAEKLQVNNAQLLQANNAGQEDLAPGTQGPKSLLDVMKNLDSKIENLNAMQKDGNPSPVQPGTDRLSELSSKFDDVKVEINLSENASPNGTKVTNGALTDELQTRAMMKQLADQEWLQNDLALRDLVARQAQQEMAIEKMGLDRLEQMSQMKLENFDRLQAQELQSANAVRQSQMRESVTNSQPQWLSYKDLSPDQKAMIDSLSTGQSLQNLNQTAVGESSGLSSGSAISNRLENTAQTNKNGSQTANALSQDAVAGIHSLAQLTGDNNTQQQSKNSNSQGSSRGGADTISGMTAGSSRTEGVNAGFDESVVNQKNDARARESERTREMARSAALRAQSIASELAIKGGGTAKVQIKDSQLGVVELRINMTDNNRVSVELIANSDRIKKELEKQTEELKAGLEKHKVVLEGVHFATDARLGDSTTQNSSQSDNSRSNQQQQQQQNLSSFSQSQSGFQQQNSSGSERFFESPRTPLNNPTPQTGNVRKNYSGKNDSQTNVQRAANGSLKVSA